MGLLELGLGPADLAICPDLQLEEADQQEQHHRRRRERAGPGPAADLLSPELELLELAGVLELRLAQLRLETPLQVIDGTGCLVLMDLLPQHMGFLECLEGRTVHVESGLDRGEKLEGLRAQGR